ncbi:hypothetical protein B0H19DRAFT_1142624 [Mycena capillaripes]|nr:hypothetical protein B0H19DRAFT_1142624 [Mycena capillaripes]
MLHTVHTRSTSASLKRTPTSTQSTRCKILPATSSRNRISSCPASGTSIHTASSPLLIRPTSSSTRFSQVRPFTGTNPSAAP